MAHAPVATNSAATGISSGGENGIPLEGLSIPSDLARQLIGKAGSLRQRFQPPLAMTQCCTEAERKAVEALMTPFVASEKTRRASHTREAATTYKCQPSASQASALKKMVFGYAQHLEQHLEKLEQQPESTQRRLRESYKLLDCLNRLISAPQYEGTLEQALYRQHRLLRSAGNELRQFEQRLLATDEIWAMEEPTKRAAEAVLTVLSAIDRLFELNPVQAANDKNAAGATD
jgi:hypothetical protein